MYLIAYIDRSNFAYAISAVQREFGVTASQAGFASGIFFVSYILFQAPGGYLAQKWGAKRYIFWSMLVWGAAATLCGFSRSFHELLLWRFCLGMGESGVWPAATVLLTRWFVPAERARANAYWVLAQPCAVLVAGPASGWLLDRYDWRWMFVVEGLLPILFAGVWWWAVQDRPPDTAPSSDQPIESNQGDRSPLPGHSLGRFSFLRNRNVPILLGMNLAFSCGIYGLLMWLPAAIQSLSARSNLAVGTLTAIPYLFAAIGIVYIGHRSDKARERRWHIAIPLLIAGLTLNVGYFTSKPAPLIGLVLLCATCAAIYGSYGPKWAVLAELLPAKTLGLALGFLNGIASIGSFFGPVLFGVLRDKTGAFAAGFVFLGCCLAAAGILALLLDKPERTSLAAA